MFKFLLSIFLFYLLRIFYRIYACLVKVTESIEGNEPYLFLQDQMCVSHWIFCNRLLTLMNNDEKAYFQFCIYTD